MDQPVLPSPCSDDEPPRHTVQLDCHVRHVYQSQGLVPAWHAELEQNGVPMALTALETLPPPFLENMHWFAVQPRASARRVCLAGLQYRVWGNGEESLVGTTCSSVRLAPATGA